MDVSRRALAAPVCAVFLLLVSGVAHADPIRVIAGGGTVTWPFEASVVMLSGAGLQITGEGHGTNFGGPGAVGTTGNLDGRFDLFPISGALSTTVNGVTYQAVLDGRLTFTTERFLVQPPVGGPGTQTTFQAPFTMTGRVQGYAPAGPVGREHGELLFDIDLFGSGIAAQTKTFNLAGGYLPLQAPISYTFQDTAVAPTPEPASLLLLGTGLAGLVMRHRRRA